jgi:hypothetical protein
MEGEDRKSEKSSDVAEEIKKEDNFAPQTIESSIEGTVNPIETNEENLKESSDTDSNPNPSTPEILKNAPRDLLIGISDPTKDNEVLSDIPSSPKVFVSLKLPEKETIKKSPSTKDSFKQKLIAKEAKITSLRLKKKADEILNLRSVPQINPKSKKILKYKSETKIESVESVYFDEESATENFETVKSVSLKYKKNSTAAKIDVENLKVLKSALQLRENLKTIEPEAQKPKLSLEERTKLAKEKIETKRLRAEEKRNANELEECTFKPYLLTKTQISDTGTFIINRSRPGIFSNKKNSLEDQNSIKKSKKNVPPPNSKRHVIEECFEITTVQVPPIIYTQLSPTPLSIRYKIGFNQKTIELNAKPMVDYNIRGNE